jgi:hypothetical protein
MGQLALRERCLPPRGIWSLGARRIATGAAARRRALVVLALAAGLAAAGVSALVLGERLVASLTAPAPTP